MGMGYYSQQVLHQSVALCGRDVRKGMANVIQKYSFKTLHYIVINA